MDGRHDQYVSFDLSLARGLTYYTGLIYECVVVDGGIKVCCCLGERVAKEVCARTPAQVLSALSFFALLAEAEADSRGFGTGVVFQP